MKKIIILLCVLTAFATALLFANKPAISKKIVLPTMDSLVVIKSKEMLYAYGKKKLIKTYNCSIGENKIGPKVKQGDNRTPEGIYYITMRNANSNYYKNLHINYPNAADKKRCAAAGIKNPGGDIKIHGYRDDITGTSLRNVKFNYTWGCVGVTNADMDELFSRVQINSPINIKP